MNIGILQGIGTVLAMVAFIGVCVWAWSSKNKQGFDDAAQLPFIGDDLDINPAPEGDTEKSKAEQEDQGRQNHE